MNKVSIIGAGNVGATAAMKVAEMMNGGEVVLLDIKEGVAEGKAMDISQALAVNGNHTRVSGVTSIYEATSNSDVVVITSGVPRKPGMTREELVGVNKGVVESVMSNLLPNQNENTIYIVVSNPMDTMTMAVLNSLKNWEGYDITNPEKKVIGMGGLLDSNRFKYFIQKAYEKKYSKKVDFDIISCYVIGGHGDTTMVPYVPGAVVYENPLMAGTPIKDLFNEQEIAEIVENTKKGGATLTKLLGTSAWEAPAAAICKTIELIMHPINFYGIPCSVYRKAYDLCIGSYVTLNNEGVDKIYEVEANEDICEDFKKSVAAVSAVNAAL